MIRIDVEYFEVIAEGRGAEKNGRRTKLAHRPCPKRCRLAMAFIEQDRAEPARQPSSRSEGRNGLAVEPVSSRR